jgi:integrase
MSVQKRGSRWHYAFCIRGVRYRGALPEARTKFEAEKAETKIRQDVYDGRNGKPIGDQDLMEFVEKVYLPWARQNKRTWKHDEFRTRIISECFKGKTLAEVSPLLVEKFKKERRESITKTGSVRSAASVNRELEVLSKIFNLAIDYGVAETNPCRKVRKLRLNNKRIRYLSDEEEMRLFAVLTGQRAHLQPMVTIAIGTGMRRGDQLNLRWEKVDFQRNVIHVPNSKTGRDYTVPMNQDVRNELLALRKLAAKDDYVFTNPKTGKSFAEIKRSFRTACRLAGIDNLRWHDLRHTFGTRLGDAGCAESTIAQLMGHASVEMAYRYTHATEHAKRAAVEAARIGRQTVCHNSATNNERPVGPAAVNG